MDLYRFEDTPSNPKQLITVKGLGYKLKKRTDTVIPSAYVVSDFEAGVYNFLAYTAKDPDAIMVQIKALFGETTNWSRTDEEFNNDIYPKILNRFSKVRP